MVSLPTSSDSDGTQDVELEYLARMVEDVPGFVMRCGCGADAFLLPCPNPPNVGRLAYSCTNREALVVHTKKFWDVAVTEEIQLLKNRIQVTESTRNVAEYYVERLRKVETEVRLLRGEVADIVTRSLEAKKNQQTREELDKQRVDGLWSFLLSAGFVAVVCAVSVLLFSKFGV